MQAFLAWLNLLVGAALAQTPARSIPLPSAHAHNDYEHTRPLLDALDHGFCSIEADVWLVEGQLLVAHERESVRKERTLQALYLDPLRKRVKRNGGQVYTNGPILTLLIDFKSEAAATYSVLCTMLEPYERMLTMFYPDRTESNAVTVIITGNRPRERMESEPVRLAGYEGRVNDLDRSDSPHFMPLISDDWAKHFKWRGDGPLPDNERTKLRALVAESHNQGKRIRFWNIPDSPVAWDELMDAGVDLINVDDLSGFREFCLTNSVKASSSILQPAKR